ncbi:hypothetical protein C1645_822788 [Glomus cerebriforme]|uniref:Uncharacterized protein n=1 Tax=Glomus cerebriforme TaxID=658196 RepID=A0A397SXE0_9GLOM|nr:hypothetical protein C1645_822788 [Glomus cerebriforme]
MSIDSAASLLQTVNTISGQLTRGLTVSVVNSHKHYYLRNMEYWSETDCFNAPTISIDPGSWGVGAFRSKVTCGTKGILCYELVLDPWKLKNRLFLIIGWNVPLLGDNTYFAHIAHIDSPDFPRNRSERKRLCGMLMKSQIRAGDSISIHISPEVEDCAVIDENDNDDKDNKDEDKSLTSFSICATMATSAIANLKIEINPCSESIRNKINIPLSISIPGQKFSFTRYMEVSFQNAENIVNEALKKYMFIREESNSKKEVY